MDSTWEKYDFPVLCAIVERAELSARGFSPEDLSNDTGIDTREVRKANRRLASEQPPYFGVDWKSNGDPWLVGMPTGHARRTVGQWPTAETLADRVIDSLQATADAETDPEKKSRLRRIAEDLAGIGREVLVKAAAQAISSGLS